MVFIDAWTTGNDVNMLDKYAVYTWTVSLNQTPQTLPIVCVRVSHKSFASKKKQALFHSVAGAGLWGLRSVSFIFRILRIIGTGRRPFALTFLGFLTYDNRHRVINPKSWSSPWMFSFPLVGVSQAQIQTLEGQGVTTRWCACVMKAGNRWKGVIKITILIHFHGLNKWRKFMSLFEKFRSSWVEAFLDAVQRSGPILQDALHKLSASMALAQLYQLRYVEYIMHILVGLSFSLFGNLSFLHLIQS